MRYLVLPILLSISGCVSSRYDTLDNCAVMHEQFLGYTYHKTVDCSDQENDPLVDKINKIRSDEKETSVKIQEK